MATNLKTDYKDYIPPESGKRYIITTNSQGYSTIQDATEYTQEGDTFGANDINTTNNTINNLTAADVGAVPSTGGSFTGTVNLTNANVSGTLSVSGTLNEITPDNYLRQEYKKLQVSSGTPALDDIINGFGFCYADSTGGVGHGGTYLSVSGWENNSHRLQLMSASWKSLLSFRTRNGDKGTWNAWANVLTDNINATISAQHGYSSSKLPQIYGNGSVLQLGVDTNDTVGVVLQGGVFREAGDGSLNLGNGSHRWAVVYSKTGSINTSDRNEKNTIADIDPEQAEKLIMGLKPSTFKFNDGTSGRTHWGMISQDIEELLPQIGMSDLDFAGFIKSPKTEDYYEDVSETVTDEETGEEKTVTRKELKTRTIEGEYIYSLRYDEFIAPLICMVQKQQRQIQDLERRLSALESKEEAK